MFFTLILNTLISILVTCVLWMISDWVFFDKRDEIVRFIFFILILFIFTLSDDYIKLQKQVNIQNIAAEKVEQPK